MLFDDRETSCSSTNGARVRSIRKKELGVAYGRRFLGSVSFDVAGGYRVVGESAGNGTREEEEHAVVSSS